MLKERALQIWTNNENNVLEEVKIILDVLIHQSLPKINRGGNIRMDDQLQDMDLRVGV